MGTETSTMFVVVCFVAIMEVKLNNPLMGTETYYRLNNEYRQATFGLN